MSATQRLVLGPDFANSSRFHSAPFQRQPVNRSTGPRLHYAAFHRLKSSKTGKPRRHESESFAKSPQPAGRALGLPETSALTTPPTSAWPLPPGQADGLTPAPQPSRRRPASHPAVRSQNSAAPRPDHDCPPDWICHRRQLARGTGRSGLATHSVAQMAIICSMPPHDLPQAQHKSRVPAVSKGRRPGN
jgi:hypothetical protein